MRLIIPIFLVTFCLIVSIWFVQLRDSLIITPRNLVSLTCTTGILSMVIFGTYLITLDLVRNKMKLVFLIFNDNLFNLNHFYILSSSWLVLLWSPFRILSVKKIFVSSANINVPNDTVTVRHYSTSAHWNRHDFNYLRFSVE